MSAINIVLGFRGDALIQGMILAIEKESSHYSIVAVCKTGSQLVEEVKKYEPQIVIMSPGLRDCSSVEAIYSIKEILPDTAFLILARSSEYHLIQQYIDAGVKGFIPQTSDLELITKVIALVSEGGFVVLPPITDIFVQKISLLGKYSNVFEQVNIEHLSPREREILKLVADGLDNREISQKLYISLNTVKVHLRKIMDKTNIHHRYQLIGLYEYITGKSALLPDAPDKETLITETHSDI